MKLRDTIINKIDAVGGKTEMIKALEKCKKYSKSKYRSDFDITIIYINAIYGDYIDDYELGLMHNIINVKLRLKRYNDIHKQYKCNHLKAMIDIISNNINYVDRLRLLAS